MNLAQRLTTRLAEALPEGRNRRLAAGIASGVLTKGVAFLLTLVTVPVTLHYLGLERYGIWVTMIPILAYLSVKPKSCDVLIGRGEGHLAWRSKIGINRADPD